MASDAAGTTQENTVSKTDFDKVSSQNAELSKSLESLKGQLLDTDYLSYLENKKAGKVVPPQTGAQNNTNVSVANLTLGQLQQVIAAQMGQTLNDFGKPIYERLNAIGAQQEVEHIRSKYADFDDFRDQTVAILESTPNTELNIEQAYLIAKASAANNAPSEEVASEGKASESTKGNEKPGGTVPLPGESAKRFKDPQDAGSQAWAEVRSKYGLTGDTI